jgi:hypothetical protein
MRTNVTKGVDDEIEFKGFKGRYFYQLAATVLALMTTVFILYSVGGSSIYLLIFALVAGLCAYTYIKFQMDRNGKHGHIHRRHDAPTHIIINAPFHKLAGRDKKK